MLHWIARRPAVFIMLLAVALLPGYALTANKLTDHDCFIMGEVAQRVLAGETLYAGAWDNKPPLALLWYAAPLAAAPGSYQAIQVMLWGLVTAEALVAVWLLRGEAAWFRVLAGAVILLMPLQRPVFAWASSEDIGNFFLTPVIFGSYRALRRGGMSNVGWAAIGAALALAFHARQTTIVFAVVPLVAVSGLTAPGRVKRVALEAFTVGGLIAWAALLLALSPVMSMAGYVQTVFRAPGQYRGHYWLAADLLDHARADAVMLTFFGAAALLTWAGPHRRFSFALAAAAAVAVFAPMRPFPHYFEQVTPVLALLLPAALAGADRRRRVAGLVAVAVYLAFNAAMTVAYLGVINTAFTEEHVPRRRMDEVAAAVRQAARPGDSLLAAGRQSPYLAFTSGLRPATPFFWDGYWDELVPLSGTPLDEARAALEEAPPTLLVLQMDSDSDRLPQKVEGHTLAPLASRMAGRGPV